MPPKTPKTSVNIEFQPKRRNLCVVLFSSTLIRLNRDLTSELKTVKCTSSVVRRYPKKFNKENNRYDITTMRYINRLLLTYLLTYIFPP